MRIAFYGSTPLPSPARPGLAGSEDEKQLAIPVWAWVFEKNYF
jgi:hypothetical protein